MKKHQNFLTFFADLGSVQDTIVFSNYLQLIASFPAPCYPLFCHNHSPQTYGSLLGGRKC